jgi:hypothetical protein
VIIELVRVAYLQQCTLGWLDVDSVKFATMERPWIPDPGGPGGRRRESCIPDGDYAVRPHTSTRFPDTYALTAHHLGVWYQPGEIPEGQPWGRSAIVIHAGNRVADVVGCIAVGNRHALSIGEHAVLDSRSALDRLRSMLGREGHSMVIRPTRGTAE